jgi:hypothetical protein
LLKQFRFDCIELLHSHCHQIVLSIYVIYLTNERMEKTVKFRQTRAKKYPFLPKEISVKTFACEMD